MRVAFQNTRQILFFNGLKKLETRKETITDLEEDLIEK